MWSKFMAFLVTLVFLAAGSILLLALSGYFVNLEEIFSFVRNAYADFNTRFTIIFIGTGLLALGLFNIYLAMISFRRKNFVVIRGPQGDIQIAYRAIDEVIEKVRRDVGGIDKISTRIIPNRRKISLEIQVFLGSAKNVIDVSRRVQEFVKEEMERVLGITNLGKVKVFVKRIAIEKEKRYEDILEQKRSSREIELQR